MIVTVPVLVVTAVPFAESAKARTMSEDVPEIFELGLLKVIAPVVAALIAFNSATV